MSETEILYYPENEYQREFDATVIKSNKDEDYVVLDRTLFYKEGGGQPADKGKLKWNDDNIQVVDVQKEHGEIRHYVDGRVPEEETEVHGEINWKRRYSHMRMHTAQHVVSMVVLDMYDASTDGNQVHEDTSRIDFEPADFDEEDLEAIEKEVNQIIDEDIALDKSEMDRDVLEEKTEEGRTNLDLIPSHIDPLRAVKIGDIDICPCGGTHVDSTGELEEFRIEERKSKGQDVERIIFSLN
ncbi:alanyl-tRNA editing protein [Nanohaloarchaea archaeon]|nr:alanyl-tRNA editing protein [Candidatus Nanohaloarchaea archaeon]